jgi:hypothetical protein
LVYFQLLLFLQSSSNMAEPSCSGSSHRPLSLKFQF